MVRQLKDARLFLSNKKEDSMHKVLNQKIPVAAIFGGMCIGILSVTADILGAIGSGTGI